MTNAPAEVGAPTSARRRRMPIIAEVLLALVTVALVQAFVVKPFGVPSQSMEQTLQIGDRLLVNRLDPVIERQDVVVFGHGITWSDRELPPADGALSQFARNGDFFGAPAAIFCFVDRQMGPPQWSDLGMFLQTFMLLAVERGLATCAQEYWSVRQGAVRSFVGAPDNEMLFCGMAIGHADPAAAVNSLRSERMPLDQWARFV